MSAAGVATAIGLLFALVLGVIGIGYVMSSQAQGVVLPNGVGSWYAALTPILYGVLAFIGLGTVIAILWAVFKR